MKKLLATILALVMALGLCSVSWAETTANCTGSCEHEAAINGTHYDKLQEAVNAAEAGTTVKLLSNISVSGVIEITKDLTLDLNGKVITVETQNGRPFDIKEPISFTVDANGGGMIIPTNNQNCYGLFKVSAAATLTLNGGTYKGDTNRGSAYIRPSAIGYTVNLNNVQAEFNKQFFYADGNGTGVSKLNVSGGSYTSTATVSNDGEKFPVFIDKTGKAENYFEGVTIVTNGGLPLEQVAGKATIRNCNIEVKQPSEPAYIASALAVSYGGTMTISGGTYTSAGYGVYVYSSGGTIIVDGAPKVTAASAAVRADATANATAKIDIASGEFNGEVQVGGEGNKMISVSGGTFSNSVNPTYLADGLKYEVYAGGKYSYYSDFDSAAAAAAAGRGEVIKVGNSNTGVVPFHIDYADGTGVKPVLRMSKDNFELPTPTRSGYTFKGWKVLDCEGTQVLFAGPLSSEEVKSKIFAETAAGDGAEVRADYSDGVTLTAVWSANSYYYYSPTSDTTTSTTTKGSPKTFDAGVGIYAVTALLSVTGMAWAGKKRH